MNSDNKTVVLVTGGSSGIGKAAVDAFVKSGCMVYEISRREMSPEGYIHISADVTDETAIAAAIQQIVNSEGCIDIVINCAGFGISGAIEYTQQSDAKSQFEVNFWGMVNVNKAVIPYMRSAGKGRIINISSVAAIAHIPFQAYYSATKAAINSYTCALANEVRPFGIAVTAIQPGDIATGFTAARHKDNDGDDVYNGRISRSIAKMEHDEQNGMSPEYLGKYIAKIAFRRSVKPIYTAGIVYKFLSLIIKLLPCRIVNALVGMLYSS